MIDVQKARHRLDARESERAATCARLHEQASKDADAIVQAIAERFHPRRIRQWGSVLNPERFGPMSDIDIALEGITSPAEFSEILDLAWSLTRFAVDIVQMEKIEPEFAELIRRKGRVVYDNQASNQ